MDEEERPEDTARRFAKDLIQAQKDLATRDALVRELTEALRVSLDRLYPTEGIFSAYEALIEHTQALLAAH
jgi:hypothetical protein